LIVLITKTMRVVTFATELEPSGIIDEIVNTVISWLTIGSYVLTMYITFNATFHTPCRPVARPSTTQRPLHACHGCVPGKLLLLLLLIFRVEFLNRLWTIRIVWKARKLKFHNLIIYPLSIRYYYLYFSVINMVHYYCHKNLLILGVEACKFEIIHFYTKIVTILFQYLIFWCHRIIWCQIRAEKNCYH